ncbi:MAG: amidohydrolase family protein, partial [Acidimicrobiales bacterium]|nr:amidohydrolase family protein [Acidimicrobiales bacterium]
MTSLLVRGKVHTFDKNRPVATNLLLRDGTVYEIDSDADEADEIIELRSNEILQPGWRDDHLHLLSTLASHCSIDLSKATSVDEVLELLTPRSAGDNGWMRGWGYEPTFLREKRHPTRSELDQVTLEIPTVVHDRSGHVAVVNSAAAELLKIKGFPDGILVEREDVLSQVPRLEIAELKRTAADVFKEWRRMGVVAVTDATHTNDQGSLDVLAEIREECGGPRITAMIGADRLGDLRFGETYKGIEIGHAKVMPDVGLQEDLSTLVATAHRAGFPVAVHVMDIDMLDETLLALETSSPPPSTIDRLEHCSLAMPEQLDRVAQLGVSVCTQPSFLSRRLDKYLEDISPIEQSWLWPLSSLVERDISVTLSSDSPVVPVDPDEWIHVATTRPIQNREAISESDARAMTVVSPIVPGLPA